MYEYIIFAFIFKDILQKFPIVVVKLTDTCAKNPQFCVRIPARDSDCQILIQLHQYEARKLSVFHYIGMAAGKLVSGDVDVFKNIQYSVIYGQFLY